MCKRILLIVILTFFITGCGKLKGNFAFKKLNDDVYRKVSSPLEFEKNEKINWVYIFKDVEGIYNIVVTLVKREIIWVDISSRSEKITKSNKIIYGIIENLPEGLYKIIISSGDQIIDDREFLIFSDEEEYYKYDEK